MAKSRVDEIWAEYQNASDLEGKQGKVRREQNSESTRKAIVDAFLSRVDPLIKNLDKGEIEELLGRINDIKDTEERKELEDYIMSLDYFLKYFSKRVDNINYGLECLEEYAMRLLSKYKNVIGEDKFAEQSLLGLALIKNVDLSFNGDFRLKCSKASDFQGYIASKGGILDKFKESKEYLEEMDDAILQYGKTLDKQVEPVIQWVETIIGLMESALNPWNIWVLYRKHSFNLREYKVELSSLKKDLRELKSCKEEFLNKKKLSDFDENYG